MRTKFALIGVAMILAFAVGAVAEVDIKGVYQAAGANPGGKGNYTGTVTISQTGETYKILWNVGKVYIGTGILQGDTLSVAYTDENKSWFGLVVYQIKSGGQVMEGKWTGHNGQTLGTETLTKK